MFTHFYSDPHFGHANIIDYCKRPFAHVHDMNEELIARYNQRVGISDHVLWCGDVAFMKPEQTEAILKRLQGRRSLVLGNHDKRPIAFYEGCGFEKVNKRECVFALGGFRVKACHFPPNDRRYPELSPKLRDDEFLVHGHTHDARKVNGRCVHVGVDAWDYGPADADSVVRIMQEAGDEQLPIGTRT